MERPEPRRIVIIGGGFSGTVTAVHCLRAAPAGPREIVLVEESPELGRGRAYARSGFPYLLNVPASRMSATPADPDEFLRYCQVKNPAISGEDFLPRSLYGDYLQQLLEFERVRCSGNVQFRHLRGEAVDVEPTAGDGAWEVRLADGNRIAAEVVVLAVGADAPRRPASIDTDVVAPLLRRTPWSDGRLLASTEPLCIIGNGLTMADVVTEALARAPNLRIHTISRHGLLPAGQTAFHPEALSIDPGVLLGSERSIRRLVAEVRLLAAEEDRAGGDWREVIMLVRRLLPTLWTQLPVVERSRFARHVQAYWDVHRHRLPDSVLQRLVQLREWGQLTVHAGRVEAIRADGGAVRVRWRPRGSRLSRALRFAEVVDCTGPSYDISRSRRALCQALLRRGLATPDPLHLGVQTGPSGVLMDAAGSAQRPIYYIGPMLRAAYWEATAVGELRQHAVTLADRLMT